MIHQTMNSVGGRYEGTMYDSRTWEYHFHNSFELIYVFAGTMKVTVNDRVISLLDGDFFVISPCMVHRIHDSEGCLFFIAIFTEDYVPEWANEKTQAACYHFSMEGTALSYVRENLLGAISPERYVLRSCLYAVCAQARKTGGEMAGERNISFVYAVNRYIAEHIACRFRRVDIAEALGYEEHYFSCLFRKELGLGFKKYLNIYRFSMAQHLLLTSDRTMADIAFSCGFPSIRSFNTIFRELSGKTPSEYRKEEKIKGEAL